ncbi:MarR family winged helix-turn-helix transcriptional regulator [Ruegeria atlantica]|uniref:MarR family winged helix-turn-helix transcriptional regulator n=1 Tax=Ruegeria atlantica TaxID=81569 RepID=UPI00147A4ED2|nr:MarR family transcriptional regulator [Ruegeria atlantica]
MADQVPIRSLLERIKLNWPEAASPETDIIFSVIRLNELIRARTEEALASFDLTHAAFEVLVALRAQPKPRQLTPSDLCKSALLTTGGAANILVDLERRSLVTRAPNPSDGRSKIVQLTDTGEHLIERAMKEVMEHDKLHFENFRRPDGIESIRCALFSAMSKIET